ncbi:uncharacterized protein Tdg [Planococcus citri]|uniref:uncharacterized protein Tdg n=1 Tax=Planococcus citri TaxID=170843 RepID=UPI0031F7C95E
MTEMEDDLILESVTYFKYPSSTNENEMSFDPAKVKEEASESSTEAYESNDYPPPAENYPFNNYSSYFPHQNNQCHYENNGYGQYNNYPIKQEIKSEYNDYCNKEQDCYSSPLSYMNTQYGYQHPPPPPPQQQPYQNGQYWNGWSQPYQEQSCCSPQSVSSPAPFPELKSPQPFGDNNGAKKRGRKKKIKVEPDDGASTSSNFSVDMSQLSNDNDRGDIKTLVKERRKHDRFNGMPEEEVSKRTLPDLLASNLDIVIIGINPGLFAAYKGHHYAGPGNHFWKCLYLSGLIGEQLTADDDYKLLQWGIGFTNMVERATKGSSDLTRKEIREGGQILLEKLQKFKPKIAVFNGKLIFEVFSGKKEFNFGRQPDFVDGTNTYMWVMPSSSARCAQLPRASDKVPYYTALKKFRDYLNGAVSVLDENDIVFQYCKLKTFPRHPKEEIKVEEEELDDDELGSPSKFRDDLAPVKRRKSKCEIKPAETTTTTTTPTAFNNDGTVIVKKKRGRPKKIRPSEDTTSTPPTPTNGTPAAAVSVAPFTVENVNAINNNAPATSAAASNSNSSVPTTPVNTSKYFSNEVHSPGYCHSNNYSPSYQHQFSSPSDAGYYSQNSLESAFNTFDFHPSEIQSHLRSFLPSSKPESACSLNE